MGNNRTTLTKSCGAAPNLTVCPSDRKRENPEIEAINNRIKQLQPDGDQITDYEYDAAGNTTKDPSNRRFKYDGENKQIKVVQLDANGNETSTIGEYFFDGDGKRVKKAVPSTGETTIFHYDAAGKLIAEYSTAVEPVASAQTSYLTNDHLGSPRITTDNFGNVNSRRDFLPFGEEITVLHTSQRSGYGNDSIRQKFTGYERDYETGLDFAEARIHNFDYGRFSSADPLLSSGRINNPQSWSRYAYVLNNPLFYVDPTGLYECSGTPDQCKAFRDNLAAGEAKLVDIEKQYRKDSKEYKASRRALNSYGCESVGGNCVDENGNTVTDTNGKAIKDTSNVFVDFNNSKEAGRTSLSGKKINVSFFAGYFTGTPYIQGVIAHEGSHVAEARDFLDSGKNVSTYEAEFNALLTQFVLDEFVAKQDSNVINTTYEINNGKKSYEILTWDIGWETADLNTVRNTRRESINAVLSEDQKYRLTPTNAKGKQPFFFKSARQ